MSGAAYSRKAGVTSLPARLMKEAGIWRVFFATVRSGTQAYSTAYFFPGRRTSAMEDEPVLPETAFITAAMPAPNASIESLGESISGKVRWR